MSKKTFVIDFDEDRIPLRILSINKGRRREKNEEEGFQLYFIWTLCHCKIHKTCLHMQDEGWFLNKEELTSNLSEKMGRMLNFS